MKGYTRYRFALDLSSELNITKTLALRAARASVRLMESALRTRQPVRFSKFGTFEIVYRKPRLARCPARPEVRYRVPGRWTVRFRPSETLIDELNV